MFCCAVVVMASCNPYRLDSQNMLDAFETAQLVYGNGESDTVLFIPNLDKASAYYAQKKDYGKAALAGLFQGYAEKDYDKAAAMESFKAAEQYGEKVHDSLTMARAQFQMGKLLFYDGAAKEALVYFKKAHHNLGDKNDDQALVMNGMATSYMLLHSFDSAASCLDKSLYYTEQGNSNEARRKALNNYAVLHIMQGAYGKAVDFLRLVDADNDHQLMLNYLNIGDAFAALGENDSTEFYYSLAEEMINANGIGNETKVAAYGLFSRYEEGQGHYQTALRYRKCYDSIQCLVGKSIEQKNIYRTQQKYDFAVLENEIHQERMRNRLSILVIIILTLTAALLLALLVIRHKQTLREEEEMQRELDKVKRDLMKSVDADIVEEELSWRLKMMLKMKQLQEGSHSTKMKQEMMEKHIMDGGETCFDTASSAIEKVYPELASTLKAKYPSLSDTELKVCMLSIKGLTNSDIADILGISVHTVNKSRSSIYRKMGVDSDDFRDRIRGLGCNR